MNNIEVRIKSLTKSFEDRVVLENVSLDIAMGEVVAIVGGSDCGKTVLLNHILGQLTPDRGQVWVANHDRAGAPLCNVASLSAMELDDLHSHWGVVFQRNALFSGTVLDNLTLWLEEVKHDDPTHIRQLAKSLLLQVGLPNDDAFLERNQDQLSGGMAKRLAVARALSMQPKVFFYDEPTSGLDPTSAAQIQDLIFSTHQPDMHEENDLTTVIITHDKDLLMRLRPRTIMLHLGQVHFDGPFEAFENADSDIVRPYFDLMPMLHARPAEPDRSSLEATP